MATGGWFNGSGRIEMKATHFNYTSNANLAKERSAQLRTSNDMRYSIPQRTSESPILNAWSGIFSSTVKCIQPHAFIQLTCVRSRPNPRSTKPPLDRTRPYTPIYFTFTNVSVQRTAMLAAYNVLQFMIIQLVSIWRKHSRHSDKMGFCIPELLPRLQHIPHDNNNFMLIELFVGCSISMRNWCVPFQWAFIAHTRYPHIGRYRTNIISLCIAFQ